MSRFAFRSRGCLLLSCSLVSTWLSGCSGLTQPYPKKNLFAISAAVPAGSRASPVPAVLCVKAVRIAVPYDEKTFTYKTGESTFVADYYNGFVAEPDRLLTGELTRWLSESGVFRTVVNASSSVDYDLSLETNVTALYGDYSAKDSPKAVVEARVFLIRETGKPYNLLFQKVYRESEPLAGHGPEQLVQGWERGLGRMLEGLVADLRAVAPPSSGPVK